jgi:hypothetical protein
VVAVATIVQVEAATVGRRNATTCNARLRIDSAADKRASASKIFSAAAVIASVAAEAVALAAVGGAADDT